MLWFKEQSPSFRVLLAQTKVRGCHKDWGLAQGLCEGHWPRSEPNKTLIQGDCSYSDMAKVKLPFKGTFPPTYRSFDPVLTSQLPFKGIKARSLFVYMSAMTPASHHVVAGLGWANPARCQGSHCLLTGWVSQQRPGGGATKMPKRPLGSVCEVSWLTCKQKGSSLWCL